MRLMAYCQILLQQYCTYVIVNDKIKYYSNQRFTVKPVLRGHSKVEQKLVFKPIIA